MGLGACVRMITEGASNASVANTIKTKSPKQSKKEPVLFVALSGQKLRTCLCPQSSWKASLLRSKSPSKSKSKSFRFKSGIPGVGSSFFFVSFVFFLGAFFLTWFGFGFWGGKKGERGKGCYLQDCLLLLTLLFRLT